jgi:hypothetical protein
MAGGTTAKADSLVICPHITRQDDLARAIDARPRVAAELPTHRYLVVGRTDNSVSVKFVCALSAGTSAIGPCSRPQCVIPLRPPTATRLPAALTLDIGLGSTLPFGVRHGLRSAPIRHIAASIIAGRFCRRCDSSSNLSRHAV